MTFTPRMKMLQGPQLTDSVVESEYVEVFEESVEVERLFELSQLPCEDVENCCLISFGKPVAIRLPAAVKFPSGLSPGFPNLAIVIRYHIPILREPHSDQVNAGRNTSPTREDLSSGNAVKRKL